MGVNYTPQKPTDMALSGAQAQTQDALNRQKSFIDALTSQGGIQNQSNVFAQQQGLANQLQQQSLGQGPNPALAQLALTTGQNVKNQAALLAGQRGVGANPGLAARQIGQLGADVQQQAVGQGAALGANQQLAAQQQLQQQQALMGALANQQVGQLHSANQMFGQQALGNQGQIFGFQAGADQLGAQIAQANSPGYILGSLIGAGGKIGAAALGASGGGKIPGSAQVAGNSPKNDTVPAMLSPGEVVIPRSHVKDPKKVAAFINATLGMNLKVGKSA